MLSKRCVLASIAVVLLHFNLASAAPLLETSPDALVPESTAPDLKLVAEDTSVEDISPDDMKQVLKMAIVDALRDRGYSSDEAPSDDSDDSVDAATEDDTDAGTQPSWLEESKASIANYMLGDAARLWPNATAFGSLKTNQEVWDEQQQGEAEAAQARAASNAAAKKKWDDAYALARGNAEQMVEDLISQYGSIAAVKAHLEEEQQQRAIAEGTTTEAQAKVDAYVVNPTPPPTPAPEIDPLAEQGDAPKFDWSNLQPYMVKDLIDMAHSKNWKPEDDGSQ